VTDRSQRVGEGDRQREQVSESKLNECASEIDETQSRLRFVVCAKVCALRFVFAIRNS